jgi:hypothetical protein
MHKLSTKNRLRPQRWKKAQLLQSENSVASTNAAPSQKLESSSEHKENVHHNVAGSKESAMPMKSVMKNALAKKDSSIDDAVLQDQKRVRSNSKETTDQDSYNFNFRMAESKSGRIVIEKSTLTKGDTIQSTHQKYDGLAFTIGERVGNSVKCHVWMKAEKTYLGDMLGYEWVLLKKHSLLPRNGMIDLKYLWNGVKLDDMESSTARCYEEDSASLPAYYFELGECLNEPPQRQPVALDLFAGGGGMSRGLADAGFNVKYKVCCQYLADVIN